MRKPVPFGKYLLLDRIAVGGMAEVFAAKTFGVEGFERVLAIKRILPTMVEDDEFNTMFIDEARIAALLQHANIVQIFDLGKHDDTFFIAMEYISGRDVRLIIDKFRKQKKVMPVAMACFIMARMAEGLDYAHRKTDNQGQALGLIHRDISPQNVLVSYDGDVKVIDFGIAKAAGRLQQTQAGILKGKFGYMSPEQVRGIPIDHRSDIYSAGVMFFEMLTGTKLFSGESDFSTLEKVRAGEVPSPSEINPLVTPQLERIVLKALAKDRDERYQWAGELHEDLTRFLYSRDEIFSSKALGEFMKDAFQLEVAKEQERIRRWWATTPEETTDFDLATTSAPVPGVQVAADGKVRIGPTTGSQEEIKADDRTSIFSPFDGADPAAQASPPSDPSARRTIATTAEELGVAPVADQATNPKADGAPAPVESRPRRPASARPRRATSTSEFARQPTNQTQDRPAVDVHRNVPHVLPPPGPPPPKPSKLMPVVLTLALLAVAATGGVYAWRQLKAPTLGAYIINVEPRDGARILIDGQVPDPTMLPSGRLPLGSHRLRVEAEGFEPHEAVFELTGPAVVLDVKLTAVPGQPATEEPTPGAVAAGGDEPKGKTEPEAAATGTLVINTVPAGALVSLDGRSLGKSPARAENLPADKQVQLKVTLDGYQPLARTQKIVAGRTETLRLSLEKQGGKDVVVGEPKGSQEDTRPAVATTPGTAVTAEDVPDALVTAACMPVAMLVIDGKSTGRYTPISKSNPERVKPGKHVLGCESADGRRGPTLEVMLEPGQSFTFRGKL